jgi:hypothetical protein
MVEKKGASGFRDISPLYHVIFPECQTGEVTKGLEIAPHGLGHSMINNQRSTLDVGVRWLTLNVSPLHYTLNLLNYQSPERITNHVG